MHGHFVLKGGMRRPITTIVVALVLFGVALSTSRAQRIPLGGDVTHAGFQKSLAIDAKAGQAPAINPREARAGWGILADMAGHDYDGCLGGESSCQYHLTVRWEQPGQILVIQGSRGGDRQTDTIRSDSTGALHLARDNHGNGYWRDAVATVGTAGEVVFQITDAWIEKWRLLAGGQIEIETGRQSRNGYRALNSVRIANAQFASQDVQRRMAGFRARHAISPPTVDAPRSEAFAEQSVVRPGGAVVLQPPAAQGGTVASAPVAASGFGILEQMWRREWQIPAVLPGVWFTFRFDPARTRITAMTRDQQGAVAEHHYYERSADGRIRRVEGQRVEDVVILADGSIQRTWGTGDDWGSRITMRLVNDRLVQATRETTERLSRPAPTWRSTDGSDFQYVGNTSILPEFTAGYSTSASASTVPPRGDRQYRAGETFRDCDAVCPMMVVVPAGSFMMGSASTEEGRQASEGPRHMVTLARSFAIGQFEVTFEEWNACVADGGCGTRPSDQAWGQGRRPVMNVSWLDAAAYTEWLSGKTGQRYFLPSEAEWEYAARAGSDTPWNTGEAIITDDANFLDQFARTVPVGGYPPNAFGLHDMHGNVSEWVKDCYDVGYFGVPTDGGAMLTPGCASRIYRGGNYSAVHADIRAASRGNAVATGRGPGMGFRVARAL